MQLKQEDNLEQHNLSSSLLEHACAPTIADWQYMISGLPNKLDTELEPRVVVEVRQTFRFACTMTEGE